MKLEDLKTRSQKRRLWGIAEDEDDIILKLLAVAEAAKSVLSEEGVRDWLSAYAMGVELIDRIDALEGPKPPSSSPAPA